MRHIIGTAKISAGWKISLLKEIAEQMDAKIGDKVVYIEEDGKILIEKA